MTKHMPQRRLDEILLEQGLISEDQIREALMRQKAHGGRFGSQLLYHRYIDEAGLVKALEIQLHSPGVVLSRYNIHEVLAAMIPKRVAFARKVVPFEYIPDTNTLKVACINPNDEVLRQEVAFVARGKKVEFYVAVELAIDIALARYYQGRETSLEEHLLLDIPDDATDTADAPGEFPTGEKDRTKDTQGILIVNDSPFSVPHLQALLEREDYSVTTVDSIEDVAFDSGAFDTVLIRGEKAKEISDLSERIRRVAPQTKILQYVSEAALLLDRHEIEYIDEALAKTLNLMTNLLASKSGDVTNHGGRVGMYTDKLCRKFSLPAQDRILITSAAYVHDVARYYHQTGDTTDGRQLIQMTVKLLSSINYPAPVVNILSAMYEDVNGHYPDRLPLAVFGGNIVTLVDLFCDSVPLNDRLTLERFDAVKKRLRDLSGKLFFPEVVEVFIAMVQEEILTSHAGGSTDQIMIYIPDSAQPQSLELRLRNEGFRILKQTTPEEAFGLYQRCEPDLMIMILSGDENQVMARVEELSTWGIDFEQFPTYVLAEAPMIPRLASLLEQGVEDILAIDSNVDLLVTKIRKLQSKSSSPRSAVGMGADVASGAKGRLSDMNLIDLLQALGPGQKTVRLTIKPESYGSEVLTIYLTQGAISFAAYKEYAGPEAVYEGLTWVEGTWTVEPVEPDAIPASNNTVSNEAILMEGCRLLDEQVKSGKLL